ncbi:MAG: SlyX family protein [Geobacter sp.]|nr:SlyX family protein [Geobacter sp.]
MEERLTDLEIRYTHQERTIQELSDALFRQELKLEQLQSEVRQLREQLMIVSPSMVRSPEDEEPPPHY